MKFGKKHVLVMGYNEMEIGLKQVAAYVARWHETGRVPAIERDIALERMQKIYAELSELPCTDRTVAAEYPAPVMPDGGHDGAVPVGGLFGNDDRTAPAPASVLVAERGGTAAAFAAEAAGAEDRMSQTSHTVQEVGEQDPCPSQTRFLEDRETTLSFSEAAPAVLEREAEEEPVEAAEEEEELPEETGGRSEETFLMQESGSRDECPQATEVPEGEETEEPCPDEEEEVAPAPAETRREPKRPDAPRIFGIEVSPYARHEIIDTLFHGNQAMFDAECEKLDAMDSLEEALVYIGEMYRWIPENAATIKFIDLLEARFRTDEAE